MLTSKFAFKSRLEQYTQLHKDFEHLLIEYGGKPHWGKINFLTHEVIEKLYGSALEDFIAVKEQLDPKNLFSNAYTDLFFKTK